MKELKERGWRSAFDSRVRHVWARSLRLTSNTLKPKRLKSRRNKERQGGTRNQK